MKSTLLQIKIPSFPLKTGSGDQSGYQEGCQEGTREKSLKSAEEDIYLEKTWGILVPSWELQNSF